MKNNLPLAQEGYPEDAGCRADAAGPVAAAAPSSSSQWRCLVLVMVIHAFLNGALWPDGFAGEAPAVGSAPVDQRVEAFMTDVERWADLGGVAPKVLTESICSRAPSLSAEAIPLLTRKLADPRLDPERARIYSRVLAKTRDTRAIPGLIQFFMADQSGEIRMEVLGYLIDLGTLPGGGEAKTFAYRVLQANSRPRAFVDSRSDGGWGTLLSDIEQLVEKDPGLTRELAESVAARVPQFSTKLIGQLVPKLSRPDTREKALRVYIWALGQTRDTNVVAPLIDMARRTPSAILKGDCVSSLATVGGGKMVEPLLPLVLEEPDRETRFRLLSFLAATRSLDLLPATLEILKSDPEREYWRPVLVFGKMGDAAVPFLLERINDSNRVVRLNAINLLAFRMFAAEARQPLEECFWSEKDPEMRGVIFGAIISISGLRDAMAFLQEVVTCEREGEPVQYAGKQLAGMAEAREVTAQLREQLAAIKRKKRPSATAFAQEYQRLYDSAGSKGSMAALLESSTVAQEPELKRLRERVLVRGSDEAIEDYRKIGLLIWMNRVMEELD